MKVFSFIMMLCFIRKSVAEKSIVCAKGKEQIWLDDCSTADKWLFRHRRNDQARVEVTNDYLTQCYHEGGTSECLTIQANYDDKGLSPFLISAAPIRTDEWTDITLHYHVSVPQFRRSDDSYTDQGVCTTRYKQNGIVTALHTSFNDGTREGNPDIVTVDLPDTAANSELRLWLEAGSNSGSDTFACSYDQILLCGTPTNPPSESATIPPIVLFDLIEEKKQVSNSEYNPPSETATNPPIVLFDLIEEKKQVSNSEYNPPSETATNPPIVLFDLIEEKKQVSDSEIFGYLKDCLIAMKANVQKLEEIMRLFKISH
eukprot:454425_1